MIILRELRILYHEVIKGTRAKIILKLDQS